MFLDNFEKYGKIAFTLYNNSTELEAYRNGAYPFENRIDLIGYYYFISEDNFEKVYLKDLEKEVNKEIVNKSDYYETSRNTKVHKFDNDNISNKLYVKEFYNILTNLITKNNLLEELKQSLEENQVKNYVTHNDIIRYLLKYIDEKIYGKNKIADFLDQVFELYAPSWSPMPVIFHLDYWNGFAKIQKDIENVACEVLEKYKKYRLYILKEIIESLQKNNKVWKENINKFLES